MILLEMYSEKQGNEIDCSLFSYSPFFMLQGVYARHLLGNASAPNAAQFSQCVEPLAKVALQLAQGLVAVIIVLN